MSTTLAQQQVTEQDNSRVTPRPTMAKADVHVTTALSGVVKEAAKRAYGKQGAAASHLGKDEGNFARDVTAGRVTLTDLQRLGPEFLAELGKELVEQFGQLSTPQARLRQKARDLREIAAEIEQAAEMVGA